MENLIKEMYSPNITNITQGELWNISHLKGLFVFFQGNIKSKSVVTDSQEDPVFLNFFYWFRRYCFLSNLKSF